MTHLLDTSAILAHFLDEPGAEEVDALLAGGPEVAALAAPSWVELERRLQELIPSATEAAQVLQHYSHSLCSFIPVGEAATRAAMLIRQSAADRLPMVDALIAGCAEANGLVLVHRDRHMDAIKSSELATIRLPDKPSS